ncbi:Site-specific DNA methylase [Kingella kingae]|uniref:DNA adenine methylase n=2 Tax=Kingella kingae TaxID=504 RepID=UPI00037A82C0|nr:DNA adenine methylase [Kingella kingae]CRZ20634.1 Prophage PSPPH02, adenine modification methytransferase [Kingella kingae]STR03988.1 Site-specific DNA methylase [Kingella kingae]
MTAARFFYLQCNTFGGKTTGQTFGTVTTEKAWNATQIAEQLQAARQRLGGVFIENEPWQRCVKRYDRLHTFFYADPPYWQVTGYERVFDWTEYEQLAQTMRTMQGKMMLSINDHPDIRALFAEFNITELQLAYSVGRKTESRIQRGELVICNY